MDTNLTKVVTCEVNEAELKIRSHASQGYHLAHFAVCETGGFMSKITAVMVFDRSKQAAVMAQPEQARKK